MATESAFAGRGWRHLTQDAIARIEEQKNRRIEQLDAYGEQQRQAALAQQQAEQAQTANGDPLFDPNSNINKHLTSMGITPEQYLQMPTIQRQKEYAEPLIQKMWAEEVRTNRRLQGIPPAQLKKFEEQYREDRLNVYQANYDAIEKSETVWTSIGDHVNKAASGIVDLVDTVGDATKPYFGNDNIVGKITDGISEFGTGLLDKWRSDGSNERWQYAKHLMDSGEHVKLGKLIAENPTMATELGTETFAGAGLFRGAIKGGASLLGKGLSKAHLAPVGNAVTKAGSIVGSAPTYAGVSAYGSVAEELANQGFDVTKPEVQATIATAALGNAAISLLTPANVENTLFKYINGQGVSVKAAKAAAEKMVQDLSHKGLFSSVVKGTSRLAGNAITKGTVEAVEEYGQEGVNGWATHIIDENGRIKDHLSDADMLEIRNRAGGAAILGAAAGGAIGTGTNLNSYGSSKHAAKLDAARNRVAELNQQEAQAAEAQAKADGIRELAKFHITDVGDEHLFEHDNNGELVTDENGMPVIKAGLSGSDRRSAGDTITALQARIDAGQNATELNEKKAAAQQAQQAAADAQARIIQRDTELSEYGQFRPDAEVNDTTQVAEAVTQYQDLVNRVIADQKASNPNFDEGAFTTALNTGTIQDAYNLLTSYAAASTADVELSTDVAEAVKNLNKNSTISSHVQNRKLGADGLLLSSQERTHLADAIKSLYQTANNNITPDTVGQHIQQLAKNPNLVNPAHASVVGPMLRAAKEQNAEILKLIADNIKGVVSGGNGGTSNPTPPSTNNNSNQQQSTPVNKPYSYTKYNASANGVVPGAQPIFNPTAEVEQIRDSALDRVLKKMTPYEAQKYTAAYHQAFNELNGGAFNNLMRLLHASVNRDIPKPGLPVNEGRGVVGDLLKQANIIQGGENLYQFVEKIDRGKLLAITDDMKSWLDTNSKERIKKAFAGQPALRDAALHERFIVSAMRNGLLHTAAVIDKRRANNQRPYSNLEMQASRHLNADLANETMGEALSNAFRNNSLKDVLGMLGSWHKKGTLEHRIIERLRQRAIDSDVHTELLSSEDMNARFGTKPVAVYDNSTGRIFVRDGLPMTVTARAVLHEATHSYFNRQSYAWHNYKVASANGNVNPADFGLTTQDIELFGRVEEVMLQVRGNEAYQDSRYDVNLVEQDGKLVPYGLSYETTSPEAVGEFMAELIGNEGFRRATSEAYSRANNTNLKTGISKVREFINAFARQLGFKRDSEIDQVIKLVEDGLDIMDTVPYKAVNGGLSYVKGNSGTFETRFVQDEKRGIQYYTFAKASGVIGPKQGIASAQLDKNTGLWEMQFPNPKIPAGYEVRTGLTASDLAQLVIQEDLQVMSRNGSTHMSKHINEQIGRIGLLYPQIAKMLQSLRRLIMNFTTEENADQTIDWITGKLLSYEQLTQDRDAIYTWASRAIQHMYPNNPEKWVDLQRQVQIDRANFNSEFTEKGVGRMRIHDHQKLIKDFANKVGWNEARLNEVVYALMAQERARQFKNNPGGLNPYTGKPIRETSKVSGFKTDGQQDEDASKFFAKQSPQELTRINEFKKMWVAQNDTLLDLEYASGVLQTDTYNNWKGVFYAPLKNEWDEATAFVQRATGRSSVAKDPMSMWYASAEARVSYALKQRERQYLLTLAQDHQLGNFMQVNQTYLVTKQGEELGYEWRANNMQDGTSWVVYKDGVKHTLTVTDPTIKKILQSAKSWEHRSTMWNTMSLVTRSLSAVRTSLSPLYLPAAYGRDLISAMVNTQTAFRTMTGEQVLSDSEAASLAPKIVSRAVLSAGGILKGKWTGQRGWEYDVFKRVGGGIVMNARNDAEDYNAWFQHNLLSETRTPMQIGKKVLKDRARNVLDISHAMEDSVRFGVFMEYLEMRAGRKFTSEQDLISYLQNNQKTRDEAVSASKHITGNFETKGSSVPLRSLFMFFNASMVGGRSFVHMFNPKHGKHAVKAMQLIAAFSLASLAMVDGDLGEDEDGKSAGMRVALTENALCWGMLGCMQLPHETRFISAGVKAGKGLLTGDLDLGEAVAMQMRGLAQAGLPLSFGDVTGGSPGVGIAMGLTPTLLTLPLQLLTNTNNFGRAIVPEYAYTADGQRIMGAQDWQKFKMSDPTWAKGLALYGNEYLGVDVSASQYNHTAHFFLGSLYTTGQRLVKGITNGDDASDILSSIFLSGFTPKYDNYALTNEVKERFNTAKANLSRGDDANNMLRSSVDLKADSRYAKIVALEKQYEKLQKQIHYDGMSYAELNRLKQSGEANGDIDAILRANTGLDVQIEERQKLAGEILQRLAELEVDIYE